MVGEARGGLSHPGSTVVAMSIETAGLCPDLVGWPGTRTVRGPLVAVVNALRARDQVVVTLGDLSGLVAGRDPESTARSLVEAGWLFGLRTRGVWGFSGARLGVRLVPGYLELGARLRVRPDTPACISGKPVAMFHQWLRRPVAPAVGLPPGVRVPRCFDGFRIDRWLPQIGLDEARGLPMWKPETLLCYMAAYPSAVSWEDIAEWLAELCENLDVGLLLAELEGRSRAVWMKTGYLADVGGRPEVGEVLAGAAPTNGGGPYVLGWRERCWPYPTWPSPVRVPRYEVVDYLLPMRWYPKVGIQPFVPPDTWGLG